MTGGKAMKFTIIHTSPAPIIEISRQGLFGDSLCFSDNEYWMGDCRRDGACVYELSVESVATGGQIYYHDDVESDEVMSLIRGFAAECDMSEEAALEFICERTDYDALDHLDADAAAEASWAAQAVAAKVAVCLGYEGFKGRDEQGTVYIIPMTGRIGELVLVEARPRASSARLIPKPSPSLR